MIREKGYWEGNEGTDCGVGQFGWGSVFFYPNSQERITVTGSDWQDCAKGECSKLMEIEEKVQDKENQLCKESVELIEIPVHHGKDRTPLFNISQLVNNQVIVTKEKGGQKWKRAAHKTEELKGAGVKLLHHTTTESSKFPGA